MGGKSNYKIHSQRDTTVFQLFPFDHECFILTVYPLCSPQQGTYLNVSHCQCIWFVDVDDDSVVVDEDGDDDFIDDDGAGPRGDNNNDDDHDDDGGVCSGGAYMYYAASAIGTL